MQHLQEDGSYNQLYPKVDSYSKNETLTNNTSQMFRIDNGTPEDVMQYLGKYAQYWWKKETIAEYVEKRVPRSGEVYSYYKEDSSSYLLLFYSSQIKISGGSVELIDYQQVIVTDSTWDTSIVKGHYSSRSNLGNTAYYIPSSARLTYSTLGKNKILNVSSFETITSEYQETKLVGYIQSNDRNAYPDSGEQDGYKYTYLGVPLSNAALLKISDKI